MVDLSLFFLARSVLAGVLIMTFVVPALTYTESDFSAEELFAQIHFYSGTH
jgi:hypothetical protein